MCQGVGAVALVALAPFNAPDDQNHDQGQQNAQQGWGLPDLQQLKATY